MNYRLQAHPEDLMRAFRTGEFSNLDKASLSWALGGTGRKYMFPGLIAGARFPIFEVARCFRKAFYRYAFGCGQWLNQWASNPERPHPCARPGTFPKGSSFKLPLTHSAKALRLRR